MDNKHRGRYCPYFSFLALGCRFICTSYSSHRFFSFLLFYPVHLRYWPILLLFSVYNSSLGSWWFQIYSQPSSTSRGKLLWLYSRSIFSIILLDPLIYLATFMDITKILFRSSVKYLSNCIYVVMCGGFLDKFIWWEIYTMSGAAGLKYLHKATDFSFITGHCVHTSQNTHQMIQLAHRICCVEDITKWFIALSLSLSLSLCIFSHFIHFVVFLFGKCAELMINRWFLWSVLVVGNECVSSLHYIFNVCVC